MVVSISNEKNKDSQKKTECDGISEGEYEEPLERKACYDIEQINTVIQKHLEVDGAIRFGKKYKDKFRIL